MQGLFLLQCCAELATDRVKLRKELGDDIWNTLKNIGENPWINIVYNLPTVFLKNYSFSWRTLLFIAVIFVSGVKLDISHYNALLTIYLESEHDFSPLEFLEEIANANVLPNRVTYQKLISQFCNKGQVQEANQIIKHMETEQFPINEDILSSLIYGHFINKYIHTTFLLHYSKNISKL